MEDNEYISNTNDTGSEDTRLDYRSLADDFTDASKDIVEYGHSLDHPVMGEFRDLIYYNSMDDGDRQFYDEHTNATGKALPLKDVYEALQDTLKGKVDRDDVVERFYRGIMDDHRYQLYLEEKKNDPRVDAKYFWNKYCKDYEPENVKSMERGFRALMEEPVSTRHKKDTTPYFSREQVEKMSRKEIQDNYDAITKSQKKWK